MLLHNFIVHIHLHSQNVQLIFLVSAAIPQTLFSQGFSLHLKVRKFSFRQQESIEFHIFVNLSEYVEL